MSKVKHRWIRKLLPLRCKKCRRLREYYARCDRGCRTAHDGRICGTCGGPRFWVNKCRCGSTMCSRTCFRDESNERVECYDCGMRSDWPGAVIKCAAPERYGYDNELLLSRLSLEARELPRCVDAAYYESTTFNVSIGGSIGDGNRVIPKKGSMYD